VVNTIAAANSGISRADLRPARSRFHEEVIMNRIRRICRSLASLPQRAGFLLASAAAAPGALAADPPPPIREKHPPLPAHTHAAATGGMPGWQITLIAVAAVLLAAALAAAVYRLRAARRRVSTSAA
jgi:hypothetical protein